MEPLSEAERTRLAQREASHIVAASLLGRRVEGVTIDGNGGATKTQITRQDVGRDEAGFVEALDDLAILLIGGIIDPASRFANRAGSDAALALRAARRVAETDAEALALVELGREKARTLALRRDFVEAVETLWPVLEERGALGAAELEQLLAKETNGTPTS